MKRWMTGLDVCEQYDLLPGELCKYVVGLSLTGYHPVSAAKYIYAEHCDGKEYTTEVEDGVEKKVISKVRVTGNVEPLWDDIPVAQLNEMKFEINEVERFFARVFNNPTPQSIIADLEYKIGEAKEREEQLIAEIQGLRSQDTNGTKPIDPKDVGRLQAKIEKIPFLINASVAMSLYIAKIGRSATKDDLRKGIRNAGLPVDNLTENEIMLLWKSLPAELRSLGRPKKDTE
jgi:hypothetical protein